MDIALGLSADRESGACGARDRVYFGKDGLQDFLAAQCAPAHFGEHIVGLGQAQLLGDAVDGLVGQFEAFVGKHLAQKSSGRNSHVRHAGRGADSGGFPRARTAGDDEMLPERRRRLLVGADDLHLIAIVQRRVQRHMRPLTLAPTV